VFGESGDEDEDAANASSSQRLKPDDEDSDSDAGGRGSVPQFLAHRLVSPSFTYGRRNEPIISYFSSSYRVFACKIEDLIKTYDVCF